MENWQNLGLGLPYKIFITGFLLKEEQKKLQKNLIVINIIGVSKLYMITLRRKSFWFCIPLLHLKLQKQYHHDVIIT